jgi:PAS domain S-box-containing protein
MQSSAILAKSTLLLVDDNPNNLAALTHALAAHQVRILVAQQGEAGLQIAARARPDLILLDVQLPGADGFEICRRLKADPATMEIPVLFMTVRMEPADKLRGFQAGAVDYITKPFQSEEVLARVTTHLRLRQLSESLRVANEDLEQRVQLRTAELVHANAMLQEQIAERQHVEEVLVAERNLLRALIDNVPDNIFVKDTASRFVLANAATTSYLGVETSDQLLGKTDFDFFPAEQAKQYFAEEQSVMQIGLPLVNKEERSAAPLAAPPRWLLTTKVPVRDTHGAVIQLVGISRDITARKRLEAQLLQSQKMEGIGRLAGGVAHDFNNLLMAIIGYAELADVDLPAADPLHSDLQAILDAANRAAELTRQLLIFARKQALEPTVIDINTLVRAIEKLLRRLIGEDIELTTRLSDDPWPIRADTTQIEQVLVNLAINARDAMPGGGRLTIETANIVLDADYVDQHLAVAPGPYVLVSVSDTGTGMPPEVQARLFEPFFTTKESGKGTGLGLATCYGIIAQHGGHIWVYSEVGQGSIFKIYLPRAASAAGASPAAAVPYSVPGGNEVVLVVEDDAVVRELIARSLRQRGYTVLEGADGLDALRVAGEYTAPIDLLVTDMIMPRMGGIALAMQLRGAHPNLKVLFMSGYADHTVIRAESINPSTAFIQKPLAPAMLARKVYEILLTPNQPSD